MFPINNGRVDLKNHGASFSKSCRNSGCFYYCFCFCCYCCFHLSSFLAIIFSFFWSDHFSSVCNPTTVISRLRFRYSRGPSNVRVLRVINERLQGRYNLAVPRAAVPGAADEGNDLPLSVQGQVRCRHGKPPQEFLVRSEQASKQPAYVMPCAWCLSSHFAHLIGLFRRASPGAPADNGSHFSGEPLPDVHRVDAVDVTRRTCDSRFARPSACRRLTIVIRDANSMCTCA